MSVDSISAAWAADDFLDLPSRVPATRAKDAPLPQTGRTLAHPFAAEWLALLSGLTLAATLIGWSLFKSYDTVDLTERDRLHVQARVVDDNIGQQLDGINRALASVRDEFLATPPQGSAALISTRLKLLSDAIPGVRSMVVIDAGGTVIASSVDTLLHRDFGDRDYFLAPRSSRNASSLHVAAPFKTSLGNYTVVFSRAIVGANGVFAGSIAAALEPEYFEVLMQSVLYAPDMWVSLGHADGKVFVTMPRAPERIDSDWQQSPDVLGPLRNDPRGVSLVVGAMGGSRETRMTALQYTGRHDLALDKPLVIAVSRASSAVFGPWRKQALEYSVFFLLLSAGAAIALYRGQWRRRSFAVLEASAARERHKAAEQLGLALQGADLGLWDWDVREDVFHQNEVIRAQLGYQPGELGPLGSAWRAGVHPDDAERLISAIEAHFRRETPAYECEFRVRHKAGHWVWLLSRGKVVERDECDMPVRMTGTHMDLSRRKRTQTQMERSADMLRRTGELANIGGWELDLATMRVDWSEQVFRIHEVQPGALLQLDNALDFYAPEARPLLKAAIDAAARDGTPWDLELPFVTALGNPRWVRAQGVTAFEEGRPVRLLGAFQDITEKKTIALEMHRLNEQLTRLSTTDALTGVGNRRLFDQMLRTEWLRASRRGEWVGLLMIDIDHFKEYNDHYGHPAGDTCLREVARRVGESVRRGGELVARYGGEEFVLLLPGADLDVTRAVAERCRQLIDDAKIEHRASATSAWLSVSIGIASQPASVNVECGTLVEIADAALYRAKRCGRGRIEF